MYIIYGDDNLQDLQTVSRGMRSKGYEVLTLDTSQPEELTGHFKLILKERGVPAVFILDGHNVVHNKQGDPILDLTPLGMLSWLRQNGLSEDCKFILYSNDDNLVARAQENRILKLAGAVCKNGNGGGLGVLLKTVEKVLSQ